MTNKDLIDKLKRLEPDARVEVQCWGFYYPITSMRVKEIDRNDELIILELNEVED